MSKGRRLPKAWRALMAAGLLGLMASSAQAQGSGYDANCNPKDYTADELLQQEICSAHVGCRLTLKFGNSACKVKNFVSNLGGVLGGRSTPDNLDVVEALNRTEVPQTPGVRRTNASVRPRYEGSRLPSYDRTNAAQISLDPEPSVGKPGGYLNRDNDGTVRWFEGSGWLSESGKRTSSGGVQIDSKGDIKAGILDHDVLSGYALRRAPDGSWAAGNFTQGRLDGMGYALAPDGMNPAPVLEGTFKNGLADGMMLATWPDGASRKELWQDGKLVRAGARVAKGQFPQDPKTPEQEAAERAAAEKARFDADLAKLPNPGAVYAFADEWASRGDMDKARAAWRSLLTRFPGSPLALKAADRLGSGGASDSAGASRSTGTGAPGVASDLTGEWRGETTGNVVYIKQESGAILVSAVTLNPGQDPNSSRWTASGVGTYVFTFPDGNKATTKAISRDRLEVVQPGVYETFRRTGAVKAPSTGSLACKGGPAQSLQAFNQEFASFNARYPIRSSWGMRDTYKYSIFLGAEGQKILERYRGCMSKPDFDANWNALNGAKEKGLSGCRATSSDGGAGCVAAYPD